MHVIEYIQNFPFNFSFYLPWDYSNACYRIYSKQMHVIEYIQNVPFKFSFYLPWDYYA